MNLLLFWVVISFSLRGVIGLLLNRRFARKWHHFEWDKGLTTAVIIFSTVIMGWVYVVAVQYEEYVRDAPHYSDIFDNLLPPWYDRIVEVTLPNILIALGATATLSRSVSGCIFRLVVCFILCWVWGFLGGRFPWDYAYHVGAMPGTFSYIIDYPSVQPSMLKPLWTETGLAVAVGLVLAMIGYHHERRRSRESQVWF